MKKKRYDLQLFAEGGGDGTGAASAAPGAETGPGQDQSTEVKEPALRPAQERLARRSGVLKPQKAAEKTVYGKQAAAPDQSLADAQDKAQAQADAPAKDKNAAFAELMQGEYKEQFDAFVGAAIRNALKNAPADPRIGKLEQLTKALGAKYGVDPGDLDGLAEAINGPVKDDAYYQAMAMQRGVSVETAKQMDAMETENRQMKAQRERMRQQQLRAELDQKARAVRADWDRQAEALKGKYPDFDFKKARENRAFSDFLSRGVPVETAYQAAFFRELMEKNRADTAKAVEKGVADRIAARSARPTENGIGAGATALVKTDVASLTKADREEIERRAHRGERIVF